MIISVNGEQKSLSSGIQLLELVQQELSGKELKGIAVAVNNKIVPKQQWEAVMLNENDSIEIVHAVQGG